MSDFDKEAERERLREKYERDKRKRETSERMSDLLLKGATMTNAHCDDCGDPIFRYEGEEFCPTCQQVVTGEDADAAAGETANEDGTAGGDGAAGATESADDGQDAADAGTAGAEADTAGAGGSAAGNGGADPSHVEIKEPTGPAVETGGRTGSERADAAGATDASAGPDGSGGTTAASERTDAADPAAGTAPSGRPETEGRATGSEPRRTPDAGTPSEAEEDFAAARASLVRTLRSQARRAENCEDPRRACDHLAAAREAAETLSALPSY